HPPFSGALEGGYLWGRGASDTKGSLVAQVSALGLLQRAGLRPPGDVFVAAVVGEETGGYGTRYLMRTFEPPIGLVIIGEPSANTLRRGHRGRYEFVITFHGRSAHASNPAWGRNPHYSMARFLLALREAPMVAGDTLPASSVVPTLSYVDQTSSNVIPARLTVHLDWRAAPADTAETARAKIEALLATTLEEGITADVEIRRRPAKSYTGMEVEILHHLQGFCRPLDDPLLKTAHETLEEAFMRPVPIDVWTFCTGGGILAAEGIPCLG
ncbi:MAG: M20/M25/M40 family metallo-hydrolase, partial [Clostridia bacterium]|nr:M20/M25/M40 family metallo-hydrolase [Clostridia bacterium]